jgi:methylated-DNA-protein-cysteine methyltransferase related protein
MMREASGDEGARRWTVEDEREAARWAGRDGAGDPAGAAAPRDRREAVLARIRATPPGFVRTYGDVSPGAPRFAGTVLHGEHDPDLPWFRIVRADGSLTQGARQRKLLEAEGVPFRGDKVDMRAARVP